MKHIANAIWGIGCFAVGVYGEVNDIVGAWGLVVMGVVCALTSGESK